MSGPRTIEEKIKSEARRLGFFACGIARATPVEPAVARSYQRWLAQGYAGTMHYLHNHAEARFDPALLVEGTRSIVSLALAYTPARRLPADSYQIATYAYGQDYHTAMRLRLTQLLRFAADECGAHGRCFCDTAPVLERYWAQRAGLGWIGKNRQLIIPGGGSRFFLGELFLDAELQPDSPMPGSCGRCDRCLRACPVSALTADALQAHRCLSYLTIEHRGPIPPEAARAMGRTIYGCDRCLDACPHNLLAAPATAGELAPSPRLLSMSPHDWRQLTRDDYTRLFKGSAVKRCKFEGLRRNIDAVGGGEEPPHS